MMEKLTIEFDEEVLKKFHAAAAQKQLDAWMAVYGPKRDGVREADKPLFEVGKRYRTRNAEVVTITAYEPNDLYCYRGNFGKTLFSWDRNGSVYPDGPCSHFDLIPIPIDDTPPSAAPTGDRTPDRPMTMLEAVQQTDHWRARAEKAEAKLKRIYQCLESGLKVPVICERGEGYHEGLTDIVAAAGLRIIPAQPLRVEDAE